MNNPHKKGNGLHRSFLNTETVVLGLLVGMLIIVVEAMLWREGEHLTHSPIAETLWTAIYLTGVVAYVQFNMPVLFDRWPRLASFTLPFTCGLISLFFDSFAVILMLNTITFAAHIGSLSFNKFSLKVVSSFNALTVGGAFYLGELWGLPHYISSGFDNALAGLPLLVVLLPYSVLTSLLCSVFFPVRVEPKPFDRHQRQAAIEFVAFLLAIILTHRPILCIGILLVYSAMNGKTQVLLSRTLHELGDGGMNALGLIVVALLVQQIPGASEWFARQTQGPWIMGLSAISSPFAGAMIAPAANLHELYVNLSYLMLGATLLVSSSLVAIVVFKHQLEHEDLPRGLRWIPGSASRGVVEEWIVYTLLIIPLDIGLGLCLWWANANDVFVQVYHWLETMIK